MESTFTDQAKENYWRRKSCRDKRKTLRSTDNEGKVSSLGKRNGGLKGRNAFINQKKRQGEITLPEECKKRLKEDITHHKNEGKRACWKKEVANWRRKTVTNQDEETWKEMVKKGSHERTTEKHCILYRKGWKESVVEDGKGELSVMRGGNGELTGAWNILMNQKKKSSEQMYRMEAVTRKINTTDER